MTVTAEDLRSLLEGWNRHHYRLVTAAAEFAESDQWAREGSPTCAHWLAATADVEIATARGWIFLGRALRHWGATAVALAEGVISFAKARILAHALDPEIDDSETERAFLGLAQTVPAGALRTAIAQWRHRHSPSEDIEARHHRQRSLTWRLEPDGMTTYTVRMPPMLAATFHAMLGRIVMTKRPSRETNGRWPRLCQQYLDAFGQILRDGPSSTIAEVVIHLRGDGVTFDNGTPITDSLLERLLPESFVRLMIHDLDGRPINAGRRRRFPTERQRRFVKERDRHCVDCGGSELLEFDHKPPFRQTQHTVVEELELRCAPCHQRRHDTHGDSPRRRGRETSNPGST